MSDLPQTDRSADSPPLEQSASSGQYVVVARRYRPTCFEELIGQQHVARAMKNAIETNRVGHAYLFTGARGVGKTSAARILGKALNCASGPTASPCNECETCRSIAGGDDVDVLEIDGASNRGIDEIRQLRQNAGVRPSRSRFKIYIIDEVHMLTREAFNALLKTLEEPPEHVKFIFATTEPNKIPITILSRCQRFDFAGIDSVAIETRLTEIAELEGIGVESEALQMIARRAAGSMRDSQSLLEQLLAVGGEKITVDDVNSLLGTAPAARLNQLVDHLIGRNAAGALQELDGALGQGVEVAQLLDQLLGYFRDVMMATVGGESRDFMYASQAQHAAVVDASRQLGVETVLAIMQILEQAATRLRLSMHGRMLAEMALVRITHLEDLEDLAGLIGSLQDGSAVPSPAQRSSAGTGQSSTSPTPVKKNIPPSREPESRPATTSPSPPSAQTAAPSAEGPGSSLQFQGKLNEENAAAIWQYVLANLGEMVADQASLSECVAATDSNRLVVSFLEKYNSCKQFCERPEQKAILEKALATACGETIRLELATLQDTGVGERAAPQAPAEVRRQAQSEVLGRPMVQRAMELFEVERPQVEPPKS